jgi:hypothetical protein
MRSGGLKREVEAFGILRMRLVDLGYLEVGYLADVRSIEDSEALRENRLAWLVVCLLDIVEQEP